MVTHDQRFHLKIQVHLQKKKKSYQITLKSNNL